LLVPHETVALAPDYDLMSRACYFIGERVEDLGLKFGGSKEFHRVTLTTFRRLQEAVGQSISMRGKTIMRRLA
jgi:hypothetical protein